MPEENQLETLDFDTENGDIIPRIQTVISMTKAQLAISKKELNNVLQAAMLEIQRLREVSMKGLISKNVAVRAAGKWKSCDDGEWPAVYIHARLLKSHESLRKTALGYIDSRGAFQAVVFLWFKDTEAPVRVKDRRKIRGSWPAEFSDLEGIRSA